MASAPQFTSEPTVDYGSVPTNQATSSTVASNMRAGTAGDSNYTLVCPGPSGSPSAGVGKRLGRVRLYRAFSGTTTMSQGVVCFYYKANTALTGQNDYVLMSEVMLAGVSPSQTNANDYVEVYDLNGFVLPAGSGIYANYLTSTSGTIKVLCEGGLL